MEPGDKAVTKYVSLGHIYINQNNLAAFSCKNHRTVATESQICTHIKKRQKKPDEFCVSVWKNTKCMSLLIFFYTSDTQHCAHALGTKIKCDAFQNKAMNSFYLSVSELHPKCSKGENPFTSETVPVLLCTFAAQVFQHLYSCSVGLVCFCGRKTVFCMILCFSRSWLVLLNISVHCCDAERIWDWSDASKLWPPGLNLCTVLYSQVCEYLDSDGFHHFVCFFQNYWMNQVWITVLGSQR